MRDNKNILREALLECKAVTDSKRHKPWDNPNYSTGDLIDLDFDNKVAIVRVGKTNINMSIKLSPSTEESIKEIGHWYGITAFYKDNCLYDVSYITDDLLTPVRTIAPGVDVYE